MSLPNDGEQVGVILSLPVLQALQILPRVTVSSGEVNNGPMTFVVQYKHAVRLPLFERAVRI
jgi:hypothetical protein